MSSIIKSVGVYYPNNIKRNTDFLQNTFLKKGNIPFDKPSGEIIAKFEQITEIKERKIAADDISVSDMGFFASRHAIDNAGIDQETIDYIIVAHNWGNVNNCDNYFDPLPNLAARVKGRLEIKNPTCVAYDLLFGCPGWLEALKQGHMFIQSGNAQRVLVVGADAVSRVVEDCDIDSMLFSDGAGAVILEKTEAPNGILSFKTVSHCLDEIDFLKMGHSYDDQLKDSGLYLKMEGKKVFRYAMENVPAVIDCCLKDAGLELNDINYFLIHQANGKMIKAIGKKLFESHGIKSFNEQVMPLNVSTMGNNSVATIPTLLYELQQKQLNDRGLKKGDIVAFASVGAGMHANCVIHQF